MTNALISAIDGADAIIADFPSRIVRNQTPI
jgi:hypothetical protein